jgi:hypothetical protein
MSTQRDYIAHYARNRETFLLNYGDDFCAVDTTGEAVRESWNR